MASFLLIVFFVTIVFTCFVSSMNVSLIVNVKNDESSITFTTIILILVGVNVLLVFIVSLFIFVRYIRNRANVQPEEVTKRPTLQEQLAKLREKKAELINDTEDEIKSSTSLTKVKSSSLEGSAGISNVKSLPVMVHHPSSNEELEQSMEIATDIINEDERNKRHDFVREARTFQSLSKLRNKLVTAKIKGVKKKNNDL
jgi:hypothetical protein